MPVKPYGEREEESSWVEELNQDWRTPPVTFHEGQYNMDHNTLMFIAGQQRQQQQPNAYAKRAPNAPLGPCYNCAREHLIKDCPFPRQPRQTEASTIPVLAKFCVDCGIKHLVGDCPSNPDKSKQINLNSVIVHPLGSSDENAEETVLVDAIMRAQKTRANAEVQTEADALTSETEKQTRKIYWRKQRQQKATARQTRREEK